MPAIDTQAPKVRAKVKPAPKPIKAKVKAKPVVGAARAQEQQAQAAAAAVRRTQAASKAETQQADAAATRRAAGAATRARWSGTNPPLPPDQAELAKPSPKKRGGGFGPVLATVGTLPAKYIAAVRWKDPRGNVGGGVAIAKNAATDAAELAVTTPSSVAHLASTAVHHPTKLPGELAAPYVELAKHPGKMISERPVSTALMLAPGVRIPGRVTGRVARVAKKQTLERPAATLPGTALTEARTGSRDAFVRAKQSSADKKNPTPTVTVKNIHKRVDSHFDAAQRDARHAEAKAGREAHHVAKVTGASKADRKAAVVATAEAQREANRPAADAAFAREFGANVRPAVGHADREAARTAREVAIAQAAQARAALATAKGAHATAFANARLAVAKAAKSPTLKALETRRRNAQAALVGVQRAHAGAMAEFGVARGRAQVLSHSVGGPAAEARAAARTVPVAGPVQYAAGGHGVNVAGDALQAATQRVRTARDTVRSLDDDIAAERARIAGVPPKEHAALIRAIDVRDQARTAVQAARATADAARAQHITTKQAFRTGGVIDPANEGRLFEHKADAAHVARTLNAQAAPIATGSRVPLRLVVREPGVPGRPVGIERSTNTEPLTYTVRAVGDKYTVLPKPAIARMYGSQQAGAKLSHAGVGSSKSTPAILMRRSRSAFTQATLPFSLKWLGGQGSEAGLRTLVSGAGPVDWLRMRSGHTSSPVGTGPVRRAVSAPAHTGNRIMDALGIPSIVKKMNEAETGSGDAFMRNVSAGHFEMGGPARDFANGKSLAEEFLGTPVNQPAAAATAVGHVTPVRAVRWGFRQYTRAVIGTVNGAIEHNARKAMAGHAVRHGPLMDHRILGMTDQAITDAANGLKGTPAQFEAGRNVHKMYGRYSGFSPEMRSFIMHWTPFLPWTLNSAYFLAVHMPKDHPVQTALLADITMAEEEWRKSHDLSFHQGNRVPWYMMGGYPKPGDGYYNLGHYFPTGVAAQAVSSAGGLVLPQLIGPLDNARGIDWKGKRLVDSHGNEFSQGQDALRAVVTAIEGQVPGARQAGALTGLTPRYVDKKAPEDIPSGREFLEKQLPWAPIGGNNPPVVARPSNRVKVPGITGRVKVPGVTGRIKVP